MGRKLIWLLELALFLYLSEAKQVCPPNQKWTDHLAAECQITCLNPQPRAGCYGTIIKGCKCVQDTYRTLSGACVPLEQCKNYTPKCPQNEYFAEFYEQYCVPSCEVPDPLRTCTRGFDKQGCTCKHGYYRSKQLQNKCVPWNVCEHLKKNFPTA